MNRIILIIGGVVTAVLIWMVFDLSRYLPPEFIFTKGIKYESEQVQQEIALELKRKNIPHRINTDGFIEYRNKDDTIVKEISKKINLQFSDHQTNPPGLDERLETVNTLIMNGEFNKALDLLDQAVIDFPDYGIVYSWRGMILGMKGQHENSIADYSIAIEINPKEHSFYTNRAIAWSRLEEYEKAIQDFNSSIALFSFDAQSHFYRGAAFSNLKNFPNAVSDYRKAIKLNTKWAEGSFRTDIPADPLYLLALAEHFAESINFKKAIVIQERAIELLQKESNSKDILKYQERLKCYRNNELCKE